MGHLSGKGRMNQKPEYCNPPSGEDLRAALSEMRTYVDITEEDLEKIYKIALRHARERFAFTMPVRDIMTTDVVTTRRDTDLHEAARILSEHRISGMPVVDDSNRVIGVISEADLLVLAGLKREHTFKDVLRTILGQPVREAKSGSVVGDIMSFPPLTSKADDPVGEVAKIFDARRIKRLPVVDDGGRLLGIISRADIVRAIGKKL
jgi:CBS domain-containing membrane protein